MDTRQKIILTAYETFYKQGFHACGVELLAQQAGITKRTLYAHFGSKDGLIAAVLDYRHHDFIERMQTALNRQPESQTVEAYLQFIADWTHETDFCGCLFLHACAIVHQGGVGTTQQALRSGRPQLVVPHLGDQFDNGARAARLGCAATLGRKAYRANRVTKALTGLLSDPGVVETAGRLGLVASREDGASVAADRIVGLIAAR